MWAARGLSTPSASWVSRRPWYYSILKTKVKEKKHQNSEVR